MNKIAIWGAASGLGAAMVDYFHGQGWQVTAIARSPERNPQLAAQQIATIECDATVLNQVQTTVAQLSDEVIHISTMGSFNAEVPVDYIGHRHLIDTLEAQGNPRFLLVTSLGCGDSWRYLPERAKAVFGHAVREKSLAEAWLQSSKLPFTILRPGGLKDGAPTQEGVLSQNQEVHGVITRGEVARLSHQLLLAPESVGQIYHCVDPNVTY